MFHVQFTNPSKEFGTSGLVRDGNGNPLRFDTQEAAVDFLTVNGYENAKVVTVDEAISLDNPGGIPQVGSAANPATPGKQVHSASVALSQVKEVQAVEVRREGEDVLINQAERTDAEARAQFEAANTGTVIDSTQKSDTAEKVEDQAKVADVVGGARPKPGEPQPVAPKK